MCHSLTAPVTYKDGPAIGSRPEAGSTGGCNRPVMVVGWLDVPTRGGFGMPGVELDVDEGEEIRAAIERGESLTAAWRLGRRASTVCRQVTGHGGRS